MLEAIHQIWSGLIERLNRAVGRDSPLLRVPVRSYVEGNPSRVDSYWGEHTVNSKPFKTQQQSKDYLEWRCEEYPLLREFMDLYGQHDLQVVLDYGCGPGDDLIGFLTHTKAKKVIGMDISEKALGLAAHRVALHKIPPERAELIRISDAACRIPLDDENVDYINCGGVLHHTSMPERILQEFYRILKRRSQARIMVYNRNSLWLHLYTAYDRMILKNAFNGLTIEEAFAKNTDGEACPISRAYCPEEFIDLCRHAGFEAEFVGGYLSRHELRLLHELGDKALSDNKLQSEHRQFLESLVSDENGYPTYQNKHAGIGGVYLLSKN